MEDYSKFRRSLIVLILGGIVLCVLAKMYICGKERALMKIPENGEILLKVKLSNIDLVQNNHVGWDWSTIDGYINKIKVEEGDTQEIKCKLSDEIYLIGYAEEHDSIPDKGYNIECVSVNKLDLLSKNKYSVFVVVRENRGRYSGNTAIFKFDFEIVRKVNILEILKSIF